MYNRIYTSHIIPVFLLLPVKSLLFQKHALSLPLLCTVDDCTMFLHLPVFLMPRQLELELLKLVFDFKLSDCALELSDGARLLNNPVLPCFLCEIFPIGI